MPANVASMFKRSRTVTAEMPEDFGTVTMVYRVPKGVELEQWNARYANGEFPLTQNIEFLAESVESWDLAKDEHGELAPIDADYIRNELHGDIIAILAMAVLGSLFPDQASAANSGGRSPRAAR